MSVSDKSRGSPSYQERKGHIISHNKIYKKRVELCGIRTLGQTHSWVDLNRTHSFIHQIFNSVPGTILDTADATLKTVTAPVKLHQNNSL